MSLSIEKARSLKRITLKRNVNVHLRMNFDWKVAKAISTGEELEEEDKQYRASIVAEYNKRLDTLNEATTLEEIAVIPLIF